MKVRVKGKGSYASATLVVQAGEAVKVADCFEIRDLIEKGILEEVPDISKRRNKKEVET